MEKMPKARIVIKRKPKRTAYKSETLDKKNASLITVKNESSEDKDKHTLSINNTTHIKQEDAARQSLLKSNSDAELTREFYYHCLICKEELPDLESVYRHRTMVHMVKRRIGGVKHVFLTPDINDPNFYCKACEIFRPSNGRYRDHLRYTHHMKLLLPTRGPRNNSIPDPYDANFYCCCCETQHKRRKEYRKHLRNTHKMKLSEVNLKKQIKNPHLIPEWKDPNGYCRACEYTFSTRNTFQKHCRVFHHMTRPKTEGPEIPKNYHCSMCSSAFISDARLRQHCRNLHPKYPYKGPNYYCTACKRNFYSYDSYITGHMKNFHKIM